MIEYKINSNTDFYTRRKERVPTNHYRQFRNRQIPLCLPAYHPGIPGKSPVPVLHHCPGAVHYADTEECGGNAPWNRNPEY